jgi:hypothetical protein
MSAKPRISYVALEDMSAEMQAEMERCAREGTPRPESSAVRAHVPACFWFFADSWNNVCGNQRSLKGQAAGVEEAHVSDLMNFEKSENYDDRQKAALAYAEAIVWRTEVDDAFWNRMHAHFTEPELVELGCAIGLTLGQQSWLRLLDIDHHQVMADLSSASMAPGYETSEELKESKAAPDYWAKKKPAAEANSA